MYSCECACACACCCCSCCSSCARLPVLLLLCIRACVYVQAKEHIIIFQPPPPGVAACAGPAQSSNSKTRIPSQKLQTTMHIPSTHQELLLLLQQVGQLKFHHQSHKPQCTHPIHAPGAAPSAAAAWATTAGPAPNHQTNSNSKFITEAANHSAHMSVVLGRTPSLDSALAYTRTRRCSFCSSLGNNCWSCSNSSN